MKHLNEKAKEPAKKTICKAEEAGHKEVNG
jgi:hypothetical protein